MSSLEVTVTYLSTIQQPSTANVFLKGVFSSDKMFLQYFVFCRSGYEVRGVGRRGAKHKPKFPAANMLAGKR